MEGEGTNLIRVKLIKQKHDGLGFLVKPRKHKPFVTISALVAGGMAEQSGLVYEGDVIMRVNEIDVSEMNYENAVELLKALPIDAPVALLLRGPDGCSTHLVTTFQENGIPKTVRVTKPLVCNDTIVGRLKRTFSRSRSSSPSRNNFRQARVENHVSPVGRNNQPTNNYSETNCFMCPLERHYLVSPPVSLQKRSVMDAEAQTFQATQSNPNAQYENPCNNASPKIVVTRTESDGNVIQDKDAHKADLNKNTMSSSYHSTDFKGVEIQQSDQNIQVTVSESVNEKNPLNEHAENAENKMNSVHVSIKMNGDVQHGHTTCNGFLSDDDIRTKEDVPQISTLSPGAQRRMLDKRRGSANSPKKYVKLHNMADDKLVITDTLHNKFIEVR